MTLRLQTATSSRATRFCRPSSNFLLSLDVLLRRLEFGLPTEALGLTALPAALSRGQYLALAATGARSVDAVLSLDADTLTRCVGVAAAKALGAIAKGRVSVA